MKRAMTIIGRFAFGGWAIITGILVVVSAVAGVMHGYSRFLSDSLISFFMLFVFGLFGGIGGAVAGLLAAVLDYLIKPASDKAAPANEAADADPTVWPPAPKPSK